jgi:curli biogenesis system outer membrane secretion channel CsgG
MEKKMKTRLFLNAVIVALVAVVLSVCVSSASCVSAQALSSNELDAAIREASDYLSGKVPKGSKAVFLNIKSDYPDLSEYILSVLSENAVNDGVFSVVDRQQLDLIRAELNFQMSGEVSDESAQSIGKMLGAQSIVSGAVSKIGSLYRVQVKAIEVQSAGVQGQWSRSVPNSTIIAALTENYAPAAAGTASASPAGSARSSANSPSAPVPETVYKIGDTGPAGGIIFYDKLRRSNGWRYMEAAPAEIELNCQWGSYQKWVNGTETAVGTGKRNTEAIVIFLTKAGESETAAQFCSEIEYGGYDDWFLPSKDELNLMYQNLKLKGLGRFSGGLYWSSSEYYGNIWHCAYFQRFSDGIQYNNDGIENKNNALCVRPVRAF